MKIKKPATDNPIFTEDYYSVVQCLVKLLDTTFLWAELGRGSGKTTHILGPRLDRIQADMPGCVIILLAATYKSILDNILPALMEYFNTHYKRGYYFEVGKKPPLHFKACRTFIEDYKHTITFATGTVVQFVSCDRPESVLGKNGAHLICDEMVRIPEEFFYHNVMPALRSDRSIFGHSHYFMGITGTSSTPNVETEEDWWQKNGVFANPEEHAKRRSLIINIAYQIDVHIAALKAAEAANDKEKIRQNQRWLTRYEPLLKNLRYGETSYIHASSLSNIKILGVDYLKNQIANIKDPTTLNTAIFAIKQNAVKDKFFGKFGKQHLYSDSYLYKRIDTVNFGDAVNLKSTDLKYCDPTSPLLIGYDPGPFSSIVVAQESINRTLRVIKNFYVIPPDQHEALVDKIVTFFKNHRFKKIFLYYDRAGNQINPAWKRGKYATQTSAFESDAETLKRLFVKHGWSVSLMSKDQETILHSQMYKLLDILFSKANEKRIKILIDANECEELVSSINHSPLKRSEGKIQLDKTSERLPYTEQIYNSTQIASALMYLLWGKYSRFIDKTLSLPL